MSRIEQHIVAAWASRLASEIVKAVIDSLEQTKAELSGDDSGLANVWEEICAQVQGQESFYWDAYVETIEMFLYPFVEEADTDVQLALWAATDEGWNYLYDHHAERNGIDDVPLDTSEILVSLKGKVLSAAADYESQSVYRYIWGADNPEFYERDDEDEDEEGSNGGHVR